MELVIFEKDSIKNFDWKGSEIDFFHVDIRHENPQLPRIAPKNWNLMKQVYHPITNLWVLYDQIDTNSTGENQEHRTIKSIINPDKNPIHVLQTLQQVDGGRRWGWGVIFFGVNHGDENYNLLF